MADATATENETEQLPSDPTELLTAGDLARRLKVSLRQVRYLKAEGLLPEPILLGRSERWGSAEIAEWISAKCPSRETWEKQLESVRIGE